MTRAGFEYILDKHVYHCKRELFIFEWTLRVSPSTSA